MMRRDNLGEVRGKSAAHNATNLARLAHRPRYLLVVDLKQAYQSVDLDRLAGIFHDFIQAMSKYDAWFDSWLKYLTRDEIRTMIRYCDAPEGGLIQGGPASPYLFGFYITVMLGRIFQRNYETGIASDWGPSVLGPQRWIDAQNISYTHYADDLVFSSENRPFGKRKRALIMAEIRRAGFEISTHKTRAHDLVR